MKKVIFPIMIIFHLLLLSRLTFTAWPEMISYPYLMAHGFTLYKDYVMPYPPGLVLLLSGIFQAFDFSVEVLRVLTWTLILVEDILLYLILKRVIGRVRLMTFVFLGVFMFLQSFLDGNMLWFDFATIIPLLAAFWFGLKWLENFNYKNLFLIGFFLMLAVLIKQTAVVYLLGFGIFCWGIRGMRGMRGMGVLGGGVFVLMIPLAVYLVSTGSLTSFWNWVLLYPLTEWPKFPGYVQMSLSLKQYLFLFILLSPLMGILFKFPRILSDKILRLSLVFLIAALIAVYPRFSHFHFQPVLPFLIIIAARVFTFLSLNQRIVFEGLVVGMALAVSGYLGPKALGEEVRFYGAEDEKVAQIVSREVREDQRVFLQGIISSIYVYANRLPPKNWSDNFGWYLEIPGVQEWVIQGFVENPPEKVFWKIPSNGKWYELGVYQPQVIADFIRQNYELTGNIGGGIEIWSKKN